MNKILRRVARQILGTSYAAANQTIQLDVGWTTLKAEIQLRRMRLGIKIMDIGKDGSISQDVMKEAIRVGTCWTEEVNDLIGDTLGNRQHLSYIANAALGLATRHRHNDSTNQWDRLERL